MINFGEGIGPGASQLMQCQGEAAAAAAGRPAANNFQPFQQPQTGAGQQMQTSNPYPYPYTYPNPNPFYGNPQEPQISSIQNPGTGYHFHRPDVPNGNYQRATATLAPNPCQPVFQPGCNPAQVQGRPYTEILPQNILEQIRSYLTGTAAPIFILPAGCHQQGQQPVPQPVQGPATSPYPPSFYPYPVAMPVYQSCGGYPAREGGCQDCFYPRQRSPDLLTDLGNFGQPRTPEHRCIDTGDGVICSKRDCPASITLQALASQLLSQPGIISCAATRLILKKIPGSNIGTSIEETMERAQRSIDALTKDQLLAESRIGQQTTSLINHHMTANPPANVIPVLTLVQLKVNLLKARVENLINKKIMENQGWCPELETAELIDPGILNMKSDPELRQLMSALRQKETEERVNFNFAPYHAQRLLAESRLRLLQNKIAQLEAEFERRRCVRQGLAPGTTLTSRIVKQFSESYCTYGIPDSKLFDISEGYRRMESPDPFSIKLRNPRRLCLKGSSGCPGTSQQTHEPSNSSTDRATSTEPNHTDDKQTGHGEERGCGYSTDRSSSEESLEEVKKKLRIASHGLDHPAGERRVVAERDHDPVDDRIDRIERSSVYIEVRPDKEWSSVPRQISRSNTDLDTIPAEIGVDRVQLSGTKREAEDRGLDSDRSRGKQWDTGRVKFETGKHETETEGPLTDEPRTEPEPETEASKYAEFAVKEPTTTTTTTGLRGGDPLSPTDRQETGKTTGLRIQPKPESLVGAEEAVEKVTGSENATTQQTAQALYTSSFEIKWMSRKTPDRDNRGAYLLNKPDSGGVTGLINKKPERPTETEEIVSMLTTIRYDARPDETWEKVVERGGSGGWLPCKTGNILNGPVYSAGSKAARFNHPEEVFLGKKHQAQSTFNLIDEPHREPLANLARPWEKCPGWKSSGSRREARTGSGPEEGSPGKESGEEAGKGRFRPRRSELGWLVDRRWGRIADRLALVGSLVADTITRNILPSLNWRRMLAWFDSSEEPAVSRWSSTQDWKRIGSERERVPVGEAERDKARSLRGTILLDGEGPNYTVIRGLILVGDPDRAGSPPNPYKFRPSFLIRGRLKSGRMLAEAACPPQPFTVFKRSTRTTLVSSRRTVRSGYADAEHELRRSEKFCSLPLARSPAEKIRRSINPRAGHSSNNSSTHHNAIPVLAKYARRRKNFKNNNYYRWPVSRFSRSADRLTNVRYY